MAAFLPFSLWVWMRAIESSLVLVKDCDLVYPTFKELEELDREVDTLVALTSV